MKTVKLLSVIMLALSFGAFAKNDYQSAMSNAIEKMAEARDVISLVESANQFEMISKVETKEWLPLYYHALSYVRISFMSKESADARDAYLDKAQGSIDKMLEINDKESEIFALQSMLHTARLVIDPMNRGQSMMVKSGVAISKALELDPNNPRASYLLLSNEVGQAQFFGKDIAEYCYRINHLNNNWEELEEGKEFYPTWGKGQTQELANQCK